MCEPFSRRNPSSGIVSRIWGAPRRQSAIAELEDLEEEIARRREPGSPGSGRDTDPG